MRHQHLSTISRLFTPQRLNVLALDLTHQFLYSSPIASVRIQTDVSPNQIVGVEVDSGQPIQ